MGTRTIKERTEKSRDKNKVTLSHSKLVEERKLIRGEDETLLIAAAGCGLEKKWKLHMMQMEVEMEEVIISLCASEVCKI